MSEQKMPKPVFRKDYRVPVYLVEHIDLDFNISDGKTIVTSIIDFIKNPSNEQENTLSLDGENLKLCSLALDGRILDENEFCLDDHSLIITEAPQKGRLSVKVEIVPEDNKALEGMYVSDPIYCTQCESHGFRRITYFFDRPDVMTTYTVRIEADKRKCPVLLSNGNKTDEGDCGEGRHYAVWNDPFRKPSYLFALVAGDLDSIHDTFKTMSGRKVDLFIYTERGFTQQCRWAMESLKRAMKWDEDNYGREYDLDLFNIVAVSSFNMGAMENKSLNIFNTSTVYASPETATDAGFIRVETVVAHEYFHNWTGNRITCRDWFQLTLKEGLTVFRDQSFSGDMHSQAVQRIDDVDVLRASQFTEDAGPMAHPIRPESYIAMDNFYTVTVYEKGAEVIRMLKTLLGPEAYRKATDLYFERHDGSAVTCDDFVQCMQDASGIDMTQFMLWYSQAGTPTVSASGRYDTGTNEYRLTLSQKFPAHKNNMPALIPVTIALFSAEGNQMVINEKGDTETVLRLKEQSEDFIFSGITEKPVPSILRGFSAPVNLVTDLSEKDLLFLLKNDSDGFNRYEASNTIKKNYLLRRISGENPSIDPIIEAVDNALSDQNIDGMLRSSLLSVPNQKVLEQAVNPADPLLIYSERMKLYADITMLLKDRFIGLYNESREMIRKESSPDSEFPSASEMALRSQKNTALLYLYLSGESIAEEIAVRQYNEAVTMTDRISALNVLCDTDNTGRDDALRDFYDRFKLDRLVMDKWFAVQAGARRADIFEQLKILTGHDDFDIKNPNRARSVYLSFAVMNPQYFHDREGRGYDFLTSAVIEIDTFNPQIASRLLGPFQSWRSFTEPYSSMMRSNLESVASGEKLSPNVSEIVGKYLS